jgi:hypothetical protein
MIHTVSDLTLVKSREHFLNIQGIYIGKIHWNNLIHGQFREHSLEKPWTGIIVFMEKSGNIHWKNHVQG